MKKMFLDPDFEFVNIRLVANIVGDSSVEEETVKPQGTQPNEDFDDSDW